MEIKNNGMVPYLEISKIEVAKRQLETAIKIFLSDGDLISIHTLAEASCEILSALKKKKKLGASFIEEATGEFIRKEKREEFLKRLREAKNYFKHADRDSDEIFKFYFRYTEFVLWDSCRMYQSIAGEQTSLMFAFGLWFYSEHLNILIEGKEKELMSSCCKDLGLDPRNRKEFLELLPELRKALDKVYSRS